MHRLSRLSAFLPLLLCFIAPACAGAPGTPDPGPSAGPALAITDVSVVDVQSGRVLAGQTVLVRGSRIVSVGRGRAPAGATVVDGRGKYVIPGLWDMHVHAWDRELNTPLFAAFGITGVRDMASMAPIRAWRDSVRAGLARGPRIVAAGPILDGPKPLWGGMPGFSFAVTTAAEAGPAVDTVLARRWEMVKVYTKMTPEPFFAVAAEARRRGVPMVGHVPDLVSVGDASDAGIRSIEHNYGLEMACSSREAELRDSLRAALSSEPAWPAYAPVQGRIFNQAMASRDTAKCQALHRRLAHNGTFWTPTMTVLRGFSFMTDSAELARLPDEFIRPGGWGPVRTTPAEQRQRREESFARRIAMWGEMSRAGVRILAGTDLANPNVVAGWSLHDELEWLTKAGLSPLEALRAATLHPALFFDATDSLGTVAAGRLADLVVLDANPLEDIRNTRRIHAVVQNGRLIGPAEREALLAEARTVAEKRLVFPAAGYLPEADPDHHH